MKSDNHHLKTRRNLMTSFYSCFHIYPLKVVASFLSFKGQTLPAAFLWHSGLVLFVSVCTALTPHTLLHVAMCETVLLIPVMSQAVPLSGA